MRKSWRRTRSLGSSRAFKKQILDLTDQYNDAAIARKLGVSREYIRQIRTQAGIKIKPEFNHQPYMDKVRDEC